MKIIYTIIIALAITSCTKESPSPNIVDYRANLNGQIVDETYHGPVIIYYTNGNSITVIR